MHNPWKCINAQSQSAGVRLCADADGATFVVAKTFKDQQKKYRRQMSRCVSSHCALFTRTLKLRSLACDWLPT